MPEKSRIAYLARRPDMAGNVRRLLRLILVVVLLVGASQGTTLAAPASWDYVALGDSLATATIRRSGAPPARRRSSPGISAGTTSGQPATLTRKRPAVGPTTRTASGLAWRNSRLTGTPSRRRFSSCVRPATPSYEQWISTTPTSGPTKSPTPRRTTAG